MKEKTTSRPLLLAILAVVSVVMVLYALFVYNYWVAMFFYLVVGAIKYHSVVKTALVLALVFRFAVGLKAMLVS